MYWICRAKGEAIPKCDKELDIGAVVPVEGYLVGLEVPGQISGSFNRVNGGIKQSLDKEKKLLNIPNICLTVVLEEMYMK